MRKRPGDFYLSRGRVDFETGQIDQLICVIQLGGDVLVIARRRGLRCSVWSRTFACGWIQRPLEVGLHSRISPNGKIILPGDLQHFFKLQVTDGNVGGGGIVGRFSVWPFPWMLDPVKFEARL